MRDNYKSAAGVGSSDDAKFINKQLKQFIVFT